MSSIARCTEYLYRATGIADEVRTRNFDVWQHCAGRLVQTQDEFYNALAKRDAALGPIRLCSFYEELFPSESEANLVSVMSELCYCVLTSVVKVVPKESAIRSSHTAIGIRSSHLDMTKFAANSDAGFAAFCGELQRWLAEIGISAVKSGPDSPERNKRKSSASPRVFRAQGIPLSWQTDQVQSFLTQHESLESPGEPLGLRIHSMADDIYRRSRVATVTFQTVPSELRGISNWSTSLPPPGALDPPSSLTPRLCINLDDKFDGITTLFSPPPEHHKVEYDWNDPLLPQHG